MQQDILIAATHQQYQLPMLGCEITKLLFTQQETNTSMLVQIYMRIEQCLETVTGDILCYSRRLQYVFVKFFNCLKEQLLLTRKMVID
ncbi:hypothetical protein WM94_22700 [Pseudomonas sp. ABFPK]|nr:hypothetical protein WM94_22700 [Pseudomonas sp. ABFPK]